MAEDLTVTRPMAARSERQARPRFVHARRFAIAYGFLGLALIGAAGLLYAGMKAEPESANAWSAWKPTADGEARLWQIVDHVGPHYRNENGELPVRILAGPPSVTVADETGSPTQVGIDGIIVAGRASDSSDARAGMFRGDAGMYILCGPAEGCGLSESFSRHPEFGIILQREALELALYTFKYVDWIDHVIVFNPPVVSADAQGRPQEVRTIVYLKRDDLATQLELPLSATLTSSTPLTPSPPEQERVLRAVGPHLYTYKVDQAPNGSTILSLARFQG